MSTLKDVAAAIEELNREFPRPGIVLALSELYDIRTLFSSYYPNVESAGVYILLDETGLVLRIGKASCGRTLGNRLGDYFKWGDRKMGEGVAKEETYKNVRYIATIGVPTSIAFEAPAIEEFLLARVEAPLNRVGVGT